MYNMSHTANNKIGHGGLKYLKEDKFGRLRVLSMSNC